MNLRRPQTVTFRPARPSTRPRWRRVGTGTVIAGVVALLLAVLRLVMLSLRGGAEPLLVILAIIVVVLVVILGVVYAYQHTLSITVDPGGVTRRAWGRAGRIPRSDLRRVVLVSYTVRSRYAESEVPLAALLDASGYARLTLSLGTWAEADVQAMVSMLGLTDRVTSLGSRERRWLAREIPGVLPWTVRHRTATIAIAACGGVLLVFGIAVAAALLTGGGS